MVNNPLKKRINVRNEIKRIRIDPLQNYLETAYKNTEPGGIRDRYEYAYYLYMRSMERIFEQISTSIRYNKGPYNAKQCGRKFTPGQKKIADKRRKLRPYFELDIATGLLQARILLDKLVGLSRSFLKGPKLPSFTSFSNHKKFLLNEKNEISGHAEYVRYFREETDWFDLSIKYIRDKFLVHQGPKHWMFHGIGSVDENNICLSIILFQDDKDNNVEEKLIHFNPWKMSYDIEIFLSWFSNYALNTCKKNS